VAGPHTAILSDSVDTLQDGHVSVHPTPCCRFREEEKLTMMSIPSPTNPFLSFASQLCQKIQFRPRPLTISSSVSSTYSAEG
jgi:hypothetical protein